MALPQASWIWTGSFRAVGPKVVDLRFGNENEILVAAHIRQLKAIEIGERESPRHGLTRDSPNLLDGRVLIGSAAWFDAG